MNNLLPGLTDESVEFFTHERTLRVIKGGKVVSFTDLPFSTISILKEEIKKNNCIQTALHDMHPTSEIKRVEQFAICRFGGLDMQGDIVNGQLQDGEYWECPMRGKCEHEGVLCKLPVVNGFRLSKQDVQLIKFIITDKTNDVIAELLSIPLGTFHLAKKYLYKKLGVQTKQEVALIAASFNIL
jgi:hypothetical protein